MGNYAEDACEVTCLVGVDFLVAAVSQVRVQMRVETVNCLKGFSNVCNAFFNYLDDILLSFQRKVKIQ